MSGKQLWQFRWHMWFLYLIIAGGVLVLVGSMLFNSAAASKNTAQGQVAANIAGVGRLVAYVALMLVVFAVLVLLQKIAASMAESTDKLENLLQTDNNNRALLSQISHGVRLSEAAKAIVFRDQDRQSLRDAVLEKLHQQDFDATYAVIDNIARRPGYENLAVQLKKEADDYKNATTEERISQIIAHIEKLCDDHLWTKANILAQNLMKTYPGHLKIQNLPQLISDRREARKRELLAAWDDAVKRQSTDESLEILRELDLYLTPNEGLALQESARDVFRNKLHGLGVQFSLAVTEKRWLDALTTGDQIMRDFPNSRMAQEIREKYDVLKQKTGQA